MLTLHPHLHPHAHRLLRRLSFAILVVAMVLAGQVATPPAAQAEVICTTDPDTGVTICVNVPDPHTEDLVQKVTEGIFAMSDAQYAALRGLETRALRDVAVRFGLTDGDPRQVLYHARSEARAQLFAIILGAAKKPAADRDANEFGALRWLADVQRRRNIAAAEAAFAEYLRFYGQAQPGDIPDNACTYEPPGPYDEDYPEGGLRWIGCTQAPGPADLGPKVPSFDSFTKWGTAVSETEYLGASSLLSSTLALDAVVLFSSVGVTGLSLGSIAGINYALSDALFAYVFPHALRATAEVMKTAVAAAPLLASETAYSGAAVEAAAATQFVEGGAALAEQVEAAVGLGVGSIASIAAVVIIGLTVAITAIIQVVQTNHLRADLQTAIDEAGATLVDPVALLDTDSGKQALLQAVVSATLTDVLVSSPASPPTDEDDPVFRITRPDGQPAPGRTGELVYTTADAGTNQYALGRRTVRSGWFADPAGVNGPVATMTMPLWDPFPQERSPGVFVSREGFDFDAAVSTVMVGGVRTWQLTAIGRIGYPLANSRCVDYHIEGCWITDRLPFLGDGGAGSNRRWATLEPNAAPAPRIAGPSTAGQLSSVTVSATDSSGAPLVTDGDGDPVSLSWRVDCPSGRDACTPTTGTGPSLTFVPADYGTHRVTLTAADQLGGTATTTRDLFVSNRPPVVTLDSAPTVADEGSTTRVVGSLDDGPSEATDLRIRWGDGTSSSLTRPAGTVGAFPFDVQHVYRTPPPAGQPGFTLTLQANDGFDLTDVTRTVVVRNVAPQVQVLSVTPPLLSDLAPGTPVSVSAAATDPGTEELLVTARWYDGTVETRRLTPDSSGARPGTVSLQHAGRQAHPAGAGPLVRLSVSDPYGGAGAADVVGTVRADAPTFGDLAVATVPVGTASRLTGTLTDANGDPVSIDVDWGDGSPPTHDLRRPDATTLDLSHTYATRGDFEITLTASDGGLTTPETVTAVVTGAAPTVVGATFATPALEGTPVTVHVALGPDTDGDAGTVEVGWGDGTTSSRAYPSGATVVDLQHVYADDGSYDASVVATDPDGSSAPLSAPTLAVADVTPTVTRATASAVTEGSLSRLAVTIADPGTDGGTLVVGWGDGAQQSVTYPAGTGAPRTVVLRHRYLDDDPTRTPVDQVAIDLAATADDAATSTARTSVPVTVRNARPDVQVLVTDKHGQPVVAPLPLGSTVRVVVTSSDVGVSDTLVGRLDWGDGTVGLIGSARGRRVLRHVYSTIDPVLTVRVNDDDRGVVVVRRTLPISAPATVP